eukprot:scaffold58844_cov55-Phaeocystis_antarctica.AAC.2
MAMTMTMTMRAVTTMTTMPPLAAQPCAAASRARVSRRTSCCSQLWPARLLGRCAGSLCRSCGRTMQSEDWMSDVNLDMGLLILMLPAATSLRDLRCVPGTRPFARELSLLSHCRTAVSE